jgi:hypothetical protein
MTYKQAIEQAAQSEVTDEVVRKISATYRWSETKVRKDIEAQIAAQPERPAAEQELVCVCGAIWEGQELVSTPPPRQWQGLTDEEIKEIIDPWGDTPIKGYTRKLFDQIEAKLKEKNG